VTLSRYRDADCHDLIRTDMIFEPDESTDGGPTHVNCREMPIEGTVGGVSGTVVTHREGTCEATGGEQIREPSLGTPYVLCCEAPPGG
jgi:hypothetical protein